MGPGRDDGASVYYVTQGVIFVKPSDDPSAPHIVRAIRAKGSKVYTTGETWVGKQGGLWAELDPVLNRHCAGWVLIEGQGFGVEGPLLLEESCTRFVTVKGYARRDYIVQDFVMRKAAPVRELIARIALENHLNERRVVLTKELPGYVPDDPVHRLGMDYTKKRDILPRDGPIGEYGDSDQALNMVYLGDDDEEEADEDYDALVAGKPVLDDVLDPTQQVRMFDTEGLAKPRGPSANAVKCAKPTGGAASFRATEHRVAIRKSPWTGAESLGGLVEGRIVRGTPYKFDDAPWLRLDHEECRRHFVEAEAAWVLIHGGSVGMGQLLRKLTPEEEEAQRMSEKAEEADKARTALELERAALDKARLGAQAHLAALAAERKRESEEALWAELRSLEDHFEVVYPSVAIRSARTTASAKVGGLVCGRLVSGTVVAGAGGDQWLRLGGLDRRNAFATSDDAFVLIDGGSVGLGQLLRRIPKEDAIRLREAPAAEEPRAPAPVAAAAAAGPRESPATPRTYAASADPASWTVDNCVEFLHTLSLGHLADQFRANGVDGEMLLALTEEELIGELGLQKLQAKKVMKRIRA